MICTLPLHLSAKDQLQLVHRIVRQNELPPTDLANYSKRFSFFHQASFHRSAWLLVLAVFDAGSFLRSSCSWFGAVAATLSVSVLALHKAQATGKANDED
jgi:hypothetical protein